jgi:hypothetical protein
MKELVKCFETYKSLRLISKSELEPGAIFIRSSCIIREKLDKSITARIPVDGGSQPTNTYSDTFAGTTDANHRQSLLDKLTLHIAAKHSTLAAVTYLRLFSTETNLLVISLAVSSCILDCLSIFQHLTVVHWLL